jgi:hypothetical protein
MKTMRIKSTEPEFQGEFVVINEEDFDPLTMEAFEPAEEADAPKKRGRTFKTEG